MDDLSSALAASVGVNASEYFVIDNDLRTISIPNSMKIAGVENDDDINRIPFRMPRYVKDTDLSEFQIRINYTNALGEGDLYMVTDKTVEEDTITFSWLLDRHAFASKGEITFTVCARLIVEGNLVDKEYNTTIHKLTVLQGLETDKAVPIDVQDHFLDWLQEEADHQLTAIQSKGTEVLNSIPADYTDLTEDVVDLKSALSYGQGSRNFFADPNATLLRRGTHITAPISYDIFSSLDMTRNTFVFRNGSIVKEGETSGNKTYGCTVIYDPVLFGENVCLSCTQETSTRLSLYIRFLDSSDAQISQKYINSDATGTPFVSAKVPAGTVKIKVWFQSNVTTEWSIKNPALTNGEIPISGGSNYWDTVLSNAGALDGYLNYFADPLFNIFRTDPKYGNPAIVFNSFLYRTLFSSPSIVYDNEKLTQPAGATGAVNYGVEVENVESFFEGHASFAINIVEYTDPDVMVYAYLRFFDDTGTQIGNVSTKSKKAGLMWVDADIPAGTKYLRACVQSATGFKWSFNSPVLSGKLSMLMPCTDMLWQTLNAELTSAAYIKTEESLTKALALKNADSVLYILNDIEITSDVQISKDVVIDGLGHTLSGNGLTSTLISITNSKATLKNLTIIGEQTVDHAVLIGAGASVEIENCTIKNTADSVVRCVGDSFVKIENCDISMSQNNDGVSPAGNSVVLVYNSKMHDCADEGLSSHNSSYAEVHGCEFFRNGYIPGTTTPSAVGSFGGCHIGGGKMGIVEGCYSHDNRTWGIALVNFQEDLTDDVEKCFNNLVQSNGSHGIYCTYCKHLTLSNNSCIDNAGDAIHFGDAGQSEPIGVASSGYVAGNIMFRNGVDEIVVDPGAGSDTLYIQ